MSLHQIPFASLRLTVEDICFEMGYRDNSPEGSVLNSIQRYLSDMERFVVTEYAYALYPGKVSGHTVVMENGVALEVNRVIAPYLKESDCFAVFSATAGAAFDNYVKNTASGWDNMLDVFLLDVIGTCTVERTGDLMEQQLESELGTLQHTNRFSPGYCGWKLTGQKELFSLLPVDGCRISLSDVCLMTPIKSISGLIGIGGQVRRKEYACNLCELEYCYKRNQKKKTI